MKHFPIFVDLAGQKVVVAGAGETAVAKLRLILSRFWPGPKEKILVQSAASSVIGSERT